MTRACLFVLALLCAGRLAAQTVVRPQPPLDSARAGLRDALLVLRDSLNTIDAAAARLQRDYREASEAALLSRARVMQDACARSGRNIPPTRQAVATAKVSTEPRVKRQRELIHALDQLRSALVQCESEFGAMGKPGQGEQVRGYGNNRAAPVQIALRKYAQVAGEFLAAMGIKVTPLGAEGRQLAS
jgi:hypothetical protein